MPAPPAEPARAEPEQATPVADEKAARASISQLWKPIAASSAGLTPPQQRWLDKLEAGDLEGLAPPEASYAPWRGMEVRAEDMRGTSRYKD
eukprot:15445760-Alexandrium_andersonii.AAC.1